MEVHMLKCGRIIIFTLTIIFTGVFAIADWDKGDISKILEKISKGENFTDYGFTSDYQILSFNAGKTLMYFIDFKAKLCYCKNSGGDGITLVPCKAVKEGYPLFAPLITWEK